MGLWGESALEVTPSAWRSITGGHLGLLGCLVLVLGAQAAFCDMPILSDSFANTSMVRGIGAPLHGAPVEVGGESWVATAECGFATGVMTNLGTSAHHVAGVAVSIDDQSQHEAVSVAATISPGTSSWVGLGLSKVGDGELSTNGQVWARLWADGRVDVLADGETHLLYSSSTAEPAFSPGPQRLEVTYFRLSHEVGVTLNGTQLHLTVADLDSIALTPDIGYASIHAYRETGYPARNLVMVDGFEVVAKHPIAALEAELGPDHDTVAAGMPAVLHCTAEGGYGSYSYQWQVEDPATRLYNDLVDGGGVEGAASQALWLENPQVQTDRRYRCRVADSNAPQSEAFSRGARLQWIQPYLADYFEATSLDREPGDPLNGVMPQTGSQAWDATPASGFGVDHLTNISTGLVRAGIPFKPAEVTSHRGFRVDAVIDAGESNWVGVGLSSSGTGVLSLDGEIWVLVNHGGGVDVFADGTTHSLYSGPFPNPAYRSGRNLMTLEYDQYNDQLEVWLNGVRLDVQQCWELLFDPLITYVSITGQYLGGYPAPDMLYIEGLTLTLTKPFLDVRVDEQPRHSVKEIGATAAFSVAAGEGVSPYLYTWQRYSGGQWVALSDDTRVSGSSTDTVEISSLGLSDAGQYRCLVTDSSGSGVQAVSAAGDLMVIDQLVEQPGCNVFELPPGNFASEDSSEFDLWADEIFQTWERVSTPPDGWRASFQTHSMFQPAGRITRTGIPVPAGYDTVQMELTDLSHGMQIKLSWGTGADDSITVPISIQGSGAPWTWQVNLSENSSWRSAEVYDGYTIRDLTVEMLTNGVTGKLKSIDVLPGPRLRFVEPPRLVTPDGGDPAPSAGMPAGNYGAGSEMRLLQHVQNLGCDMTTTSDIQDWKLDFSLCKSGVEGCSEGGVFDCSGDTGDPSQAFVHGELDASQAREIELCGLVLPPPSEDPDYLGDWTLTASFVNHAEVEPVSLTFELQENGTPNLQVASEITVDAREPGNGPRVGWIDVDQAIEIGFAIKSAMYPQEDVPVEVRARVHEPWDQVPPDAPAWQLLGSGVVGTVYLGGPVPAKIQGVTLDQSVLPPGKSWGVVDLMVTVDPAPVGTPGQIAELSETDNSLFLPSWATVSIGDIGDAVGEQIKLGPASDIALDMDEGQGQCSRTLELFPNALSCAGPLDGALRLTRFDASPANAAFVIDKQVHDGSLKSNLDAPDISATMIRYRRQGASGDYSQTVLQGWQDENEGMYPATSITTQDLGQQTLTFSPQYQNQWGVYLFRSTAGELPFGSYSHLPAFTSQATVTAQSDARWLVAKTAFDFSCVQAMTFEGSGCDYPAHYIDLIRTWAVQREVETRDLIPVSLMRKVAGAWQAVDDTIPSGVASELGIRIENMGNMPVTVQDADLTGVLTDPGGVQHALAPSGTGGSVIVPAVGSVDIALSVDGNPLWTPGDVGDHSCAVDIAAVDDDPSNNSLNQAVTVGCSLRLSLPSLLVEGGA